MRSKRAAIIFGGLVLSSLLILLLTRTILAIPQAPHAFNGEVRVGGGVGDGLEIRVKISDENQNKLLTADLTAGSVNITAADGSYGQQALFSVRGDDTDTPQREGANPGERLFFFLLTGDGTGDALRQKPQQVSASNVSIVMEPLSRQFARGVPFVVDIVVLPNILEPVDQVHVFLDFKTGDLEVQNIEPGTILADVIQSSADNVAGTLDYKAKTAQGVLARTTQFVLATLTFVPKLPASTTSVDFHREGLRETIAVQGATPRLGRLVGLELVRAVKAATSITPVLFEEAGNTSLNLSIFGSPRNIRLSGDSPSTNPRPTFTWTAPTGDSVTGPVILYEARILLPGVAPFQVVTGGVTTFTASGDVPDGPHIFQVRAVGTGDRKDAIGSLDFTIITIVPTPPDLLAPTGDAFLNTSNPAFDWQQPPTTGDVLEYQIQVVLTGDDFLTGPFSLDVVVTGGITQFLTTGGLADAPYRWRVVAIFGPVSTAASLTRTFTVDTIQPLAPTGLVHTGDLESLTPLFQWNRSTDPAPAPPGSGAGSGVDFYNIVITGPQSVTTTADDSDLVCPSGLCQFTSPDLLPGSYNIEVKAVDRAGNFSQPQPTSRRCRRAWCRGYRW